MDGAIVVDDELADDVALPAPAASAEEQALAAELRVRLGATADQARAYADRSRAASTLRAYAADWRDFSAWCAGHRLPVLPAAPETVALYLAARAATGRYTVATLQRRLSAIAQAHKEAGADSPTRLPPVPRVWAGIRRAHGAAPVAKAPLLTADVRAMVEHLPDGLLGLRDRALLLVGFAGGFRRSELVAFNMEDAAFTRDGLVLTLRRAKTGQEGQGRPVGIPYGGRPLTCPVRALEDWLRAAAIADGPLFRAVDRHGNVASRGLCDRTVARVVQRAAAAAGLDPARYAGHSLRAGLATAAAQAGVSERAILAQTGHRAFTMVRRSIREGSLFRDNAAAAVGL